MGRRKADETKITGGSKHWVAVVERSEPTGHKISEGSLRSTPATQERERQIRTLPETPTIKAVSTQTHHYPA